MFQTGRTGTLSKLNAKQEGAGWRPDDRKAQHRGLRWKQLQVSHREGLCWPRRQWIRRRYVVQQ